MKCRDRFYLPFVFSEIRSMSMLFGSDPTSNTNVVCRLYLGGIFSLIGRSWSAPGSIVVTQTVYFPGTAPLRRASYRSSYCPSPSVRASTADGVATPFFNTLGTSTGRNSTRAPDSGSPSNKTTPVTGATIRPSLDVPHPAQDIGNQADARANDERTNEFFEIMICLPPENADFDKSASFFTGFRAKKNCGRSSESCELKLRPQPW